MHTLEDRVTKLERDMDDVRRDVTAVRTLASGAHEEVGHLREPRGEMCAGFARVDAEFADVRSGMREGFTKLNLGMARITALLTITLKEDEDGV